MASAAGQCTALNVSDEKRCLEAATSLNGLFCAFHSKQSQGLYRGYKRRNAHLDRLAADPPKYLAESKVPLTNQLFAEVESEVECQEIHDHLFLKLQLLDRVIRARKLHHSRFFSMNYDYGHAKFLAQLQSQRSAVTKALERIERRVADIAYGKQKWFKWVRQCQDDDEASREKEQKKVKQEAALFRRHWKEVQRRLKELRAKEDQKKQDAFLEETYRKRMEQQGREEEEDEIDWDPIEDVVEDNRENFVNLIKRFLWMIKLDDKSMGEGVVDVESKDTSGQETNGEAANITSKDDVEVKQDTIEEVSDKADIPTLKNNIKTEKSVIPKPVTVEDEEETITELVDEDESTPKKSKKKSKKKKKNSGKSEEATSIPLPAVETLKIQEQSTSAGPVIKSSTSAGPVVKSSKGKTVPKAEPSREPDEKYMESREEMYDRLRNGSEYNHDEIVGLLVAGTVENPIIATKTQPVAEDEAQKLLTEITEIKYLLFCRLLLGQATLLPAALRANSVEEFLGDAELTEPALRDLCLKMDRPGLQEIRDACADLFRPDDEVDEEPEPEEASESDDSDEEKWKICRVPGQIPDKWVSRREKAKEERPDMPAREQMLAGGTEGGTAIDFGEIKDDGKFQRKMVRVRICGRYIWNYPSSKSMNRKGWSHFCIIAKDSSLYDAIGLCRHWDEFFELNILALWQYFPGPNWANWSGNQYRQQLLQLGFIVYFESVEPDAEALTRSQQSGRRGPYRRSHAIFEARNFMCAHIKRNDPVSRRLIQYLAMQSHELLVLVRDAVDGTMIVKPPEDERWLIREKSGMGRAARSDWNILKAIGPAFFEDMDRYRTWNFGFKEHYDVYVWDLGVGEPFTVLYNAVQRILFKAHRCCSGADLYNPSESIIKTLTRDTESHRIRDIKPEEIEAGVISIYDEIHDEGTRFVYSQVENLRSNAIKKQIPEDAGVPRGMFYSEADALEDGVLFSKELSEGGELTISNLGPMRAFEDKLLSTRKFVEGWETDSQYDSSLDGSEDDEDWEDEDEDEYISEHEDRKVDGGELVGGSRELTKEEKREKEYLDSIPGAEHIPYEAKRLYLKTVKDYIAEAKKKKTETTYELMKQSMDEQYMYFLDKEKSKIFKEVWHRADLEPQAQEHYIEMIRMTRRSFRYNKRGASRPLTVGIILWLEAEADNDVQDVYKAVAKLSPFFYPEFFESREGAEFKDSLIFNQAARAKNYPLMRSGIGNQKHPKEFWNEWDDVKKNLKGLADTPVEWDNVARPIIAQLYKAGVIRNRADYYFTGQAIAAKEAHQPGYDFFIDWRDHIPKINMPATMQDPYSITDFRTTARKFAAENTGARFAVLRLWSAPHFYPLMIGHDNHDMTSFQDLTGRKFIWMFIPKDMPNSEWSMHQSSRDRIAPFPQFKDRVVLKRNAFLVMGTDERDLRRLAMGVTYAIQRRPWRLELDLWKSFVNIDLDFLIDLRDEWLE